MRTSGTQYELLVTFMEQHGDLSKPTGNVCGKAQAYKKWQELGNILNSDSTGDSKSVDKWRKVWSDFKNNTKKKAAKLHRACTGTGGGPAVHGKLSDLESRVLAIIGVQAATGLSGVDEAGLFQTPVLVDPLPTPQPVLEVLNQPEQDAFVEAESIEDIQVQTPSPQPRAKEMSTPRRRVETHTARPVPSPSGHTTPRRRTGRSTRGVPQRRNIDEASQIFLNSEQQWLELRREELRIREMELQTQNRIREMELQAQNGWQALAKEALDLFKNYLNK